MTTIRSKILGVSGFILLTAGSVLVQNTQAQASALEDNASWNATHSPIQEGIRNNLPPSTERQMSDQSSAEAAAWRYEAAHSPVQEGLRNQG